MTDKIVKRIPENKSLYEILPKGAEGGKEFARIIDLMLFHAARRDGKKLSIFSDVAGDYNGLDSFEGDAFRKQGTTGYQYKFFPSPLSDQHRSEIKKSLKRVSASSKETKITKWILVTPQDLTESATRKDGGDVSWFEGLRKQLKLDFEIEHWGHRKLQGLFLETPALCLYYYPSLVTEGSVRKKTIQDTHTRYIENFKELNRRIEFVGMSVYKPEATRGVPMEHIYIPLSVVQNSAGVDDSADRINPLSFLTIGGRYVVLGDPGSGKSTMLRFLALAGLSKAIQERYKAKKDGRLPVLVILRRYADEIKSRRNLSLVDYIRETVQADFSLKSADHDFFEYYLESGQTLLFFDGMDELPNSEFKQLVRDRIKSLLTTYPGNTSIVTSRIVGYENPFRFDDKEYMHYRLSPLQLPEIEQFVNDWYRVRIENPKERKENVDDLVRILRDDAHQAIRELAQNPLLLTIVALVHRIDAVLPDERVVLYQKCTETLLNTWHTWKFRGTDVIKRGKVERRNRQRMEAIAYWMHTQARGTGKEQRAIVPADMLLSFLSDYIEKNERVREEDDEPRDQALNFLEFIKQRAGLLIEVGDAKYSFVHLTFQEYLTASHIVTQSEKGGADAIWATIENRLSDPAWQEVIRLLLATLKADETQEYLVEKVLERIGTIPEPCCARLLGGFLLDGIESTEDHVEAIGYNLIHAATVTNKNDQLRAIVRLVHSCITRDEDDREEFLAASKHVWENLEKDNQRVSFVLVLLASGWQVNEIDKIINCTSLDELHCGWAFRLFIHHRANDAGNNFHIDKWESFVASMQHCAATSPELNLIASLSPTIALGISKKEAFRTAFRLAAYTILSIPFEGPFPHLFMHSCLIGGTEFSPAKEFGEALSQLVNNKHGRVRSEGRFRRRAHSLTTALEKALGQEDITIETRLNRARNRARARARAQNDSLNDKELFRYRFMTMTPWGETLKSPHFQKQFSKLVCNLLDLKPRHHWEIALQAAFVPSIAARMVHLDTRTWRDLETSFENGNYGEGEIYSAAWVLFLDTNLCLHEVITEPVNSPFRRLVELTKDINEPPLRFAHCIRDLSYGDAAKVDLLVSMLQSDDAAYQKMFEDCLWRLTNEELENEKKREKPTVQKPRKRVKGKIDEELFSDRSEDGEDVVAQESMEK